MSFMHKVDIIFRDSSFTNEMRKMLFNAYNYNVMCIKVEILKLYGQPCYLICWRTNLVSPALSPSNGRTLTFAQNNDVISLLTNEKQHY